MAEKSDFESRLSALRSWLVLLARLHLDQRYRAAEASDIAQETLIDAIKYQNAISDLPRPDLERWLRRVLRNKVVDFYRRKCPQHAEADMQRLEADIGDSFLKLEAIAVDSAISPSGVAVEREELLRLAEAIERLPERDRDVIIRKDLAGWTLKQIATEAGCTIGAAAGQLRRARCRLIAEMGNGDD